MKTSNKNTRSFYLTDDEFEWIKKTAELNSMSTSALVSVAIGHLKETLEDMKHE